MPSFVEANGVALRYELSGSGPKTLALVHEMGGSLESWDFVLPRLAEGRRVLRYDTRGAGLSEKVRGSLHIDTMADDLRALLDALNVDGPVALAGVAVGAAIAIRFAARYPERAAALVAMGPATGVTGDRRAATLARAEAIEKDGMRAVEQASLAASYPPVVRHDQARFEAFRSRWLGTTRTASLPSTACWPEPRWRTISAASAARRWCWPAFTTGCARPRWSSRSPNGYQGRGSRPSTPVIS